MESRPGGPARFLKTHQLIVAAAFIALAAVVITGFAWANKGVTVVVDGRERYISTRSDEVRDLLAEADIPLSEGDVVSPDPATELRDGMTVTVRHAVPVTLRLGDASRPLRVVGATVADALIAAGLRPGEDVHVDPPVDAALKPGMTITAADAFLRVRQEEREVPFTTKVVRDPKMPYGGRRIVKPGVPGKVLSVFEVVVSAGSEGEPVLRTERVVVKPVVQVVAVGAGRAEPILVASRDGASATRVVSRKPRTVPAAPKNGTRKRMESSAYAPGHGCGTRTATGAKAGFGIVAVDPKVIPLGTKLYVPGYGYATAADTGGAIKGNRIDLCFDTVAEARAWGTRSVVVIILP